MLKAYDLPFIGCSCSSQHPMNDHIVYIHILWLITSDSIGIKKRVHSSLTSV